MNYQGKAAKKSWRGGSTIGLQAFYDAVFSHSDLAVYVIRADPDGAFRLEDANEATARLTDCPLEEMLGKTPAECLMQPIAEALETNLATVIRTRQAMTYERSHALPEGRLSWKTTLTPVVPDNASVQHVVGMTRDISYESHNASIAEHHKSLMDALGWTMPNIIYLFDFKTRRVTFTTGQMNQPLGYEPDEIVDLGDQLITRLVHPDDLPRIEAHLAQFAELPEGQNLPVKYRVLNHNREYRTVISWDTVFSRDADGRPELILGVAEDITEQDRMEEEVRDLSKRLAISQLEERRHIAEELHDSTAQHLIAVDLAMARIQKVWLDELKRRPPALGDALEDARESLDQAKRDIRVQTYLLHPPLLQSERLGEALAAFAKGFGTRAGLKVTTRIDRGANRISDRLAVPLFRVCQEALANVHRHAIATKVAVTLALDPKEVVLSIADDGVGLDEETWNSGLRWGVGLSGMRERMERLGGSLSLQTGAPGTKLVARVPRRQPR